MSNFSNASQLCKYIRAQIDEYKAFPEKKMQIIENLQPIFIKESSDWKKIIQLNKFSQTARNIIRDNRLVILKELLLEIDFEHYKNVMV